MSVHVHTLALWVEYIVSLKEQVGEVGECVFGRGRKGVEAKKGTERDSVSACKTHLDQVGCPVNCQRDSDARSQEQAARTHKVLVRHT